MPFALFQLIFYIITRAARPRTLPTRGARYSRNAHNTQIFDLKNAKILCFAQIPQSPGRAVKMHKNDAISSSYLCKTENAPKFQNQY